MSEERIRIAELYNSLQGEGAHSGLPCFFIRTAGCDLRCSWCDTPAALAATSGEWTAFAEILAAVPAYVKLVQLTGGEPLLQEDRLLPLAAKLMAPPYSKKILLETGGHRSLARLPRDFHIVMDLKLPGSGEADHDFAANFQYLKPTDEIKFVIADRADFDRALELTRQHDLERRFQLLFSPVWGAVALKDLAAWMLEAEVDGRMQTQLHKHVWGAQTTGV